MTEMTYLEAIRSGLKEELERDESVFIMGEDVGLYGGAFKVTQGLFDQFGDKRIIDTPISEAGIAGVAIGAALMGMRPVAEMQFSDFMQAAFDILTNYAAKAHYLWGVKVPLVIRAPCGGGVHGGPFHSQNPEAYYFHVPGLKIVTPSTAYDAKGLIKSAIRDDNPVIYLEHKYLYRRIKEQLPDEEYLVPIGKGKVIREGKHATIVTYGRMVYIAMEAVEELSKDGVEIEIIDLRTVFPLDEELIMQSVKKTYRLLILHEANKRGGVGAEISALISEYAFDYLDAPIMRVAAPDKPVPFASSLEDAHIPDKNKVLESLKKLLKY
ncbi:MAG: pyruvate dehydrogenase [Candidatus Fischerbacteria bacterium RBG_13_37_8]|uniref:Pyruvate dehydrogenase n=1 Tax=Candidatus Fischerbacteria bacterium RBG_13_37_8 TaxID=1817863 RepID=A0A1F5VVB8_9BACT|nr:MAG: pyruvate dehydrogenase [Candidatus Fischerbacteria bacterium RBG_13_37_8]